MAEALFSRRILNGDDVDDLIADRSPASALLTSALGPH